MRADLGWSYTLAGGMNTANALGYLLGALATPLLLRRLAPGTLLMLGAVLATLFMALCGFFVDAMPLLLQRTLAGVASAFVFISGGLMAARLGASQAGRSGLLVGLYYGGTGWGISASALLVPVVLAQAPGPHAWAWWALAALCALCSMLQWWPVRVLRRSDAAASAAVFASAAPPGMAPSPAGAESRGSGSASAELDGCKSCGVPPPAPRMESGPAAVVWSTHSECHPNARFCPLSLWERVGVRASGAGKNAAPHIPAMGVRARVSLREIVIWPPLPAPVVCVA